MNNFFLIREKQISENILKPSVDNLFNSNNSHVVIYGASKSGKTYTLNAKKGILPSAVKEILNRIKKLNKEKENNLKLFVSIFVDYKDQLYDLLDDDYKIPVINKNLIKCICDYKVINYRTQKMKSFEVEDKMVFNHILQKGMHNSRFLSHFIHLILLKFGCRHGKTGS